MAWWNRMRALLFAGRAMQHGLTEADAGDDPFALFARWYGDAERNVALLPEAMTLATATPDGVPSARMVLLKGHGRRGFVFFTNYDSRKGQELERNPQAALVLHWGLLERQIRIEGPAQRLTADESEAYFRTRSRGSRIGAWASRQSAEIGHRSDLERSVAEREREFAGGEVPLPPFWGGYRVVPLRIEFWQGRLNRLHDRILFISTGEGWERRRLSP